MADELDAASKTAIDCAKAAIVDAQTTIRAYDTKAQVLIAVLIFSTGLLLKDLPVMPGPVTFLAMFAPLVALALCGAVLFPRGPSAVIRHGEKAPSKTFFITGEVAKLPVTELAALQKATDWPNELAYELLKLASIREEKARFFLWSLLATGASLVAFFVVLLDLKS